MDPKSLEVMAPAGSFDCLHAALDAGADAVYFGVGKLNMRSRSAHNFQEEDLPEIVRLCRERHVRTYLTLNITLFDAEKEAARRVLDQAAACGVDAVIASDMAVILYARQIGMEVHISTQLSISNTDAVRFYAQWADVIVLARELDLDQVKAIHEAILNEPICGPSGHPVRIEMFVHGAFCMSVSGKCQLSLHTYGASANRGACLQVCRRGYLVRDAETGNELEIDNPYILSPKDLCTIEFLDRFIESGVKVFKIEGRARSAEYVSRCVRCYREAADAVCAGRFTPELAARLKERLAEVFNRGFWNGYYLGAPMDGWSRRYGNQSTRRKVYIGKVTNWFDRIGVAEIAVESVGLDRGAELMAIGASTGLLEFRADDIRVEGRPAGRVEKGTLCSVGLDGTGRLRRGDKIYLWVSAGAVGEED